MPPASYDLVYSSLAFHYIEGYTNLLAAIRQSLQPGGKLVFSIEHPVFMAPRQPGWPMRRAASAGPSTVTSSKARACRTGWHPA